MSSAARSPSSPLSGPVAVCVDRPLLALDRPFTYDLPLELDAGVGSLVRVRFHGKLVRGWVLGPTGDLPAKMLRVDGRASPVRFFDAVMLEVLRWMSERYVAPLALVVGRSIPPRVVGEEVTRAGGGGASRVPLGLAPPARRRLFDDYVDGARLLDAVRGGASGGSFALRTGPGDEGALAVECVGAALAAGRNALVVVPEVDPVPATVAALVEAFGDDVGLFFGGDKRSRYRMWLEIGAGRYRVVVGTRTAVVAPLADVGVVYVAREGHALHREERSPSFHVREVAAARARIERGVAVLASAMPSVEALSIAATLVAPRGRVGAPVEVVRPGPEGRAPRLVKALREARCAFVYEPLRGYGMARVCRSCGEPAACGACGGALRSEEGSVRCSVCEAPGRCANCGASDFGIARGGAERVEEWVRGIAEVRVTRLGRSDPPRAPGDGEVVVGGLDALKDFGAVGVDLVAILGADASLRRAGVDARGRALAAWAEAAAWARLDGHVIVQAEQPNEPAIQALVTGRPERFARTEVERREHSGFPVGAPVFRVAGTQDVAAALEALPHRTLLVSALEGTTVCLVALDPDDVARFGRAMRELAERGVVTRVDAEPHL